MSRASMTAGVTQPAQVLSRGKSCLSISRIRLPLFSRDLARVDPAGPAPIIIRSYVSIAGNLKRFRGQREVVQVLSSFGQLVVVAVGEYNLEKLQRTCPKGGNGTGQIHSPGAGEVLVVHVSDVCFDCIEALQPLTESFGIVKAEVFYIEYGKTAVLTQRHDFANARGIGAGENALFNPGVHQHGRVSTDAVKQRHAIGAERAFYQFR